MNQKYQLYARILQIFVPVEKSSKDFFIKRDLKKALELLKIQSIGDDYKSKNKKSIYNYISIKI